MSDEQQKKKGSLWSIVGPVALIIVLCFGIKIVYAGLEVAVSKDKGGEVSSALSQDGSADPSQSVQEEELPPSYCPFCGQELNNSFQWGQYCPFCGELVEP